MPLFGLMGVAAWGGKKKVGWFDEWGGTVGFRHDPQELERRLQTQRDSGFNRKSFDRLLEAQDVLIAKAAQAQPGSKRHEALVKAYNAAEEVAARAENSLYTPPNIDAIVEGFRRAADARHAAAIQRAAEKAYATARQQAAERERERLEREAIARDDAEIEAAYEAQTNAEIETLQAALGKIAPALNAITKRLKIVKDYKKKRRQLEKQLLDGLMNDGSYETVPDEQVAELQKQVDGLKAQNDEIVKLLKSPRKLVRDKNGKITGSIIE